MTDETQSSQGTPRPTRERAGPTVVDIGGRRQISNGRWHDPFVADYVMEKGHHWIDIGELSRFAYGNGAMNTKKRARQRLAGLFRYLLLVRNVIIITQNKGSHHRCEAVKLYNPALEQDRQNWEERLDKLQKRWNLTNEQLEKAIALAADLDEEEEEVEDEDEDEAESE